MSEVNAAIPLAVQQIQIADPAKQMMNAYTLKDMADQQAAKSSDLQNQALLRQAFSQGDMSTPEGQQALIKKVSGISPQTAQNLSKQFSEQSLQNSTIAKNKSEVGAADFKQVQEKSGMVASAAATPLMQYKDLVTKGVPPDQARAQVEPLYQQALMGLQQKVGADGKPLFTQSDFANVPANFDPDHVEGVANQATQVKDIATQKLKEQEADEKKRDDLTKNNIEQQNATTKKGELNLGYNKLSFDKDKTMLEEQDKQKDPAKTSALRKEFNEAVPVKTFQQAAPNYKALQESYKHDDPQSSADMIYAYSKLFNPGGVIRESEVNAILSASSFSDKVKGELNQAYGSILGGRAPSNLSADARREILENGSRRMQGLEDDYQSKLKDYGSIADRTGVDKTLVLPSEQGRLTIPTSIPDAAIPKKGAIISHSGGKKYKYLGGDPTDDRNYEQQ